MALLTFLGFYVSLLGAPHLYAVDGVYLADGSSGGSGGSSGSDGSDAEGAAEAVLEGARRLASSDGFPRPSGVGNIAHNLAENWGPHYSSTYGFSECADETYNPAPSPSPSPSPKPNPSPRPNPSPSPNPNPSPSPSPNPNQVPLALLPLLHRHPLGRQPCLESQGAKHLHPQRHPRRHL